MTPTTKGLYLRVEKSASLDIPDGLTYEEALAYAHQQDAEGNLEYGLYINVMFEDGEVANEAGWEEKK